MTRSTTAGTAAVDNGPKISATLDKRRKTLQTARGAAEAAAAKVVSLDEALDSNAIGRREHEAGLQVALDRVAGLKKAIKASKQERDKLRTARKAARQDDAKARQRSSTSEARYDRAVLADMLRREKDRDLSVHAATPAATPAPAAEPKPATAPLTATAPPATSETRVASSRTGASFTADGGARTAPSDQPASGSAGQTATPV